MPIKMNAGVKHAEFQEGRKIKARRDMCDAVFGIGWQAGWLLRNDPFYASVVEVLNF